MKMHHSYDVKRVAPYLVDDRIWESMEIEFAIITSDFTPSLRLDNDAPQRPFKLIEKVISQAGCRASYQSAAASSS